MGAAQQRADAGLQLQNVEGLGQIIIRAMVEAYQLVHVIGFGSEHDDGHIREFPDLLAHLKPIEFWQHDIKQYDIISILPRHSQRFLAVIRAVNLHAVLL